MTEGPINKAKGSSYLIAYRYAFTGVAQKLEFLLAQQQHLFIKIFLLK